MRTMYCCDCKHHKRGDNYTLDTCKTDNELCTAKRLKTICKDYQEKEIK